MIRLGCLLVVLPTTQATWLFTMSRRMMVPRDTTVLICLLWLLENNVVRPASTRLFLRGPWQEEKNVHHWSSSRWVLSVPGCTGLTGPCQKRAIRPRPVRFAGCAVKNSGFLEMAECKWWLGAVVLSLLLALYNQSRGGTWCCSLKVAQCQSANSLSGTVKEGRVFDS